MLSLIISTRGRPQLVTETVRHVLSKVRRPDTKVLICIDDDDEATISASKRFPADKKLIISVRPREDSKGAKYDRALTDAPADLYMPGTDTMHIATEGFDEIMVEAAEMFPDGIGCVYAKEPSISTPTILGPTARLASLMGCIYNNDYPFWFVDADLDDIARMIGRYWVVPVNMGTIGNRGGKTTRMRDLPFWLDYYDKMTLSRWLLALKIIEALDEPDWRKHMLASSIELIVKRAYGITLEVRTRATQLETERGETGPPDPGYLRALEKAKQKLVALGGM